MSDPEPIIDVTPAERPDLPPPPVLGGSRPRIVELPYDEWLARMSEEPSRTSVYADSAGREVHLTYSGGLIPPAAVTLHDGVPAAPIEFILKGDA